MAISLKTQAMASGNHQRLPANFNERIILKIRETSGPTQWTQVCGNQEWCIYGIIYHYAPFSLSNSMVMFSRLHYTISNKVPKANCPSLRKASVPHFYNPWRLPEDRLRIPAPWLSSCWYFTSGLFKGLFKEVVDHQDSFQGIKHSLDNSTILYRMYSGNLYGIDPFGPIHIPLWEFKPHSLNFKMARSVLTQFSQYNWVTPLPGSVFQLFTYSGHLFTPGEFFPS
ncbi:hypothetical protein O181_066984 [Austropuccinia psidii MF-1]|uniref:Uncharacterized protein n=1 Tax=Austropuccinia psidii MF-1 TaxID=1389203 RepID=A0A9Q3EUI1_9BASI|nr:hypothetical protein [Austropuccinia psidii MF-1]